MHRIAVRIMVSSVLLLLVSGFLFINSALAEETGFRLPSTCETNGSSCENMLSQDNLYNSWSPGMDEKIKVTFENFGIPTKAIIDDIQIKLRIRSSLVGSSWGTLFSDDLGSTWYAPNFCTPITPSSCQYNSGASFNSLSSPTFTWINTNHIKKATGGMINSPSFIFEVYGINSFLLKNTDIDVLLFNIRYHLPDPNPTPTPAPGVAPYQITPGFTALAGNRIGTFYQDSVVFDNFEIGDKIILSSHPDGTGNIQVADSLIAENAGNTFTFDTTDSCSQPPSRTLPPTDISYLVSKSFPQVTIALKDKCQLDKIIGPIYVVHIKNITPTPTPPLPPKPFLNLPWNYKKFNVNRTFTDAALSINTFFDHEYPLLSRKNTLPESSEAAKITLGYDGLTHPKYTLHDGYDWGRSALTEKKFGQSVLAAASGIATLVPKDKSGGCGNMIKIDHLNNFETRYCHLQDTGLVVTENQSKEVQQGDSIGLVGYTGNVDPPGEDGSHIHFMVIEDKNRDGNFDDNIPDGLVDPFGWQSTEPDPWENYVFNYANLNRTGNKSYYLWNEKLDNLSATISANDGLFTLGKVQVTLPPQSPTGATRIDIKPHAGVKVTNSLESLGTIAEITVRTATGVTLTTFPEPYKLIFDLATLDLTPYNTNTLSIYSSSDAEHWTKETTLLDLAAQKASAELNHLTYFALMAERKDTTPPTTTPVFDGLEGAPHNFRSDVTLSLNAQDNPDGLGNKYTLYKIGDDDWTEYSTPLMFAREGKYKIQFFSVDKDDNTEQEKTLEFNIDKTIPELEAKFDSSTLNFAFTGINEPLSTNITQTTLLNGLKEITASDLASNTASLTIDKKTIGKILYLSPKILKYNESSATPLPDSLLIIAYSQNKDKSLKDLTQTYLVKNQTLLLMFYDSAKNTTTITTNEGTTLKKITIPGLKILKLYTDKGALKFTY